ncbi:ATP-binding cassette domain-containing protein [Actinomadura sp. LD22]|uniref:ATP-binding cassette domain-containing protein n=1 Tax=Actinomadura physcomitrii TaxID=2650748 RepID=A0A6I4MB54_9ACTN|nr:ABC transporter ATP-binding protein [Actinomadura physcomitrii]MWA03468.1 ATP-binding cassette domain-containing protein [Actinomadura physcomitrii]
MGARRRTAGRSRLLARRRRGSGPAAPDDPFESRLPELTAHIWHAKDGELAETGMGTMARRLPAVIARAAGLAWRASRADTAATISLNLAAGLFTAFGLLATTGVLTALFSAGPTPDRVRDALPSLALVAGSVALRSGLQAAAGWTQARLQPQVQRLVELRLYEATTAADLTALDDSTFLDDLQRAQTRGMNAAPQVVQHAVDVLTGAVGMIAAAGTLGVLHPLLLPLLLLTAVPEGWASVRSARMRYATMLALVGVARRKWILSDLMTERRHAAEVRSFTMRPFLLGEYDRFAAHQRRVELGLARRQTYAKLTGDVLKGVATAGVYVALGLMLWQGWVPLAVAGTAVLAIRSGQTSLVNLVFAVNQCYEEGLYFGDYLAFCDAAEARVPQRALPPPDTDSHPALPADFARIEVRDVTFTYPGSDAPSLRGVSLELRRGEVVALVGENGSGKTTLSRIMGGLYEPDAGEVRWDDVALTDVLQAEVWSRVAVIAQEYTHWPMTARQNITMGRGPEHRPGEPEDPAVLAAARASGAEEVVADLARGYDTLLDRRFQGGAELSGGQWQRLAVARGFYRDAPLLICDEPTASLDARAEHLLFDRIRDHAAGRTVLLITHRLASVRYADRIYVLEHGKVIEEGDHTTLMAAGGLYADLYNLQASAYQGGDPLGGHS